MRRILILFLVLAISGCKAKRSEEEPVTAGTDEAAATSAPAAAAAFPRRGDAPCPECSGLGLCLRCGDERPCLLCDGGGVCSACDEDGRTRDGPCEACGGDGRCPDCRGDGIVSRAAGETGPEGAPLPGQCPECVYGSGFCADCGGAGTRPDGGSCARCRGEKWCPGCRGSGLDVWCSGRGLCAACEGHGQVVQGRPGPGWPEVRLVLESGEVILARVLERPGDTLTIERRSGASRVRESIAARNVDPVGYLTALARYVDPTDPAEHLRVAEYALGQDDEFLFLARAALAEARRLGNESPRRTALAERAGRRLEARVGSMAEKALREEKDPAKAWSLFELARAIGSGHETAAGRAGRAEAEAMLAAEEAGLDSAVRERKQAAERDRLSRAVRRAGEWRARAERILSRTGAGAVELQRALRAADRAFEEVATAMDRAPADLNRSAAGTEAAAAREVSTRAIVATGLRLLEVGCFERARSLAAVALARSPGSAEAARLAEAATDALARRATDSEDGR